MNTDLENRMEDWLNAHIGYCGTCYYKNRGCCDCENSPTYGDIVSDKDACGEYIPRKGVLV